MVQILESNEPNRVVDFFNNKTIFITGGSGFLGKVLIEKLLRCTNLKKIYVLLRSKRGKDPTERLQEIFESPLYELVKKQHGKGIFEKVGVIPGDVEAPDLGISPEDRKTIAEEAEIIYHSAATVQFDDSFKRSVFINVRGTKLLLQLAKDCKKLLVFCHLSTAYCQENQETLFEKTYPPPANAHRIIDMCEWINEPTLELIADKIRGTSANTYTFTKALGEGLITEQMDQLPIIIQRPSAVIPIWREPLPGWTDNVNGPAGLLIGAGKGVIRTMYARGDYFADYVSVDCVANGLICTAYDYVTYKERRVYNLTSTDEIKVTFQEVLDIGREIFITKLPFDVVLWYPGGNITSNKTLHYINFLLYQLLPALLIDMILFICGFKPFMIRVQKKIIRGYKIFEYYANRKWDFRKDNIQTIRNLLNKKEREMFKIDPEGLDIHEYFANCILGARRYLLKEKDENIPNAIRRIKMMWFFDKTVKIVLVLGLVYLIYKTLAPYF